MSITRTNHDSAKLKMVFGIVIAIFAISGSGGLAYSQTPQGGEQELQASIGQSTTLASGIEPELNDNFVWSGLISSNSDGLPTMTEDDPQSAVILPLRDDGAIYTGNLTYQSNSPVEVTVWNVLDLNNSTSVPEEFGEIEDIGIAEGRPVALTEIGSGTSGSVPFIGNVLELIGDNDEPFLVTYAIDAMAEKPTIIGNSTFNDQSTVSE